MLGKSFLFLSILSLFIAFSLGSTPVESSWFSAHIPVPAEKVKKVKKPPAAFQVVTGILTKITDGDTVHVTINGEKNTIRLAYIDAPESFFYGKKQPGGEESKANLIKLCNKYIGKEVKVTIHGQDVHANRKDGLVNVGGTDLSRYQVESGYAWVYPQYNKDPELPVLQEIAKKHRIGIWKDKNPQAPWDFRKQNRRAA